MKRTGVLLCLLLMMMLMSASVCFAEEGGLKIEAQYPENGATGTAVENASLKIWFNQDVRPQSEQIRPVSYTHLLAVELAEGLAIDDITFVENLRTRVDHELRSILGIGCKIRFLNAGTLPRSDGKAVRVEDTRKL